MVRKVYPRDYEKSVRYTDNLTIFFNTKDTIYITENKSGFTVIANRWFDHAKWSYTKHWDPFQRAMKRFNNLDTIWKVLDTANYYGVLIVAAIGAPPKIPEGIKVHPKVYKAKSTNKKEEK